MDKGGLW